MELRLRRGAREDHLTVAVFIAALLHGLVILGIRFSAPPEERPLPTLEVLLVPPGENQDANLDASYMADRNQAGAGTTLDRVRASLPEATPDTLENRGTQQGQVPEQRRGDRAAAGEGARFSFGRNFALEQQFALFHFDALFPNRQEEIGASVRVHNRLKGNLTFLQGERRVWVDQVSSYRPNEVAYDPHVGIENLRCGASPAVNWQLPRRLA